MNTEQLQSLDNLTLVLNFNLKVLYSAIQSDNQSLEICALEPFVEKIYENSNKIRNIFNNEII